MSTVFEKPTKQRDHAKLLELAVQMITKAIGADGLGAALAADKVFKAAIGKDTDSQANRNWVWITQTLAEATRAVLQHPRLHCVLTETELSPRITTLIQTVPDRGTIEPVHLNNPSAHPAFAEARNMIAGIARTASPEHPFDDKVIEQKFFSLLMTAGATVVARHPDYFNGLNLALSSPTHEPQKRELAHARHARFISKGFVGDPIFTTDLDETVSLSEVYLHLRCFWHRRQIDEDGKISITSHVDDLHKTTKDWLLHGEDGLRVIGGGPGSGKSSFARAFAHQILQDNSHRVIFVELQHLTFNADLFQALGTYVQYRNSAVGDGSAGFYDNPLSWAADDQTPVLLVFDGLDELSAQDTEARTLTKNFVDSVSSLLSMQRSSGRDIKAMILGRSSACQAALSSSDQGKLLHVAPIKTLSDADFRLDVVEQDHGHGPEGRKDITWHVDDPHNLSELDQRPDYWRRWQKAKGLPAENVPDSVTHEDMAELNVEPLLLHLLLISDFATTRWREAANNRNYVYEDILTKIYDRNATKPPMNKTDLSCDDFFRLMECLSLSAWRGGGRTGDEKSFGKLRKAYRVGKDWRRVIDLPIAHLENIALHIHTRLDSERVGFSFIHKSFGEYLAGRAVFRTALYLVDRLSGDDEPADAAGKWAELFAFAPLTHPILRFLTDEARRFEHPDEMRGTVDALTEVFNHTLRNGFPMDVMSTPDVSYRDLEDRQRNAESTLVSTLSVLAQAIPLPEGQDICTSAERVTVDWPDIDSPTFMFRRIMPSHFGNPELPFARFDFSGTCMNAVDMSQANFSECSFVEAQLFYANLAESDLSKCDFSFAGMDSISALVAIFEGANLSDAKLPDADIRSARFTDWLASDFETEESRQHDALGLSIDQLQEAIGNQNTMLPPYIDASKIPWADKEE
ncbi:hypothetical protein ASD8599_01923 [Ascidiaceihabitans donghaensis]|uniref:NACHT domain-containing protein n=1 Tax=Ascidiaceihabitans donghaensis TaxID=1510460 RepID=A0A2R8BDN1_9RHOB|nr:pentapeptide repeat-containing protein [Ascidiaceihabitans donghaensis]SPH21174.1 hypothetical protein ASD8599_01923 [Ascidiaceihabitans donghaensis]